MGFLLETPKLPTVVLSWDHMGTRMFLTLLLCPRLDGTSLRRICFAYEGTDLPDPVSVLW